MEYVEVVASLGLKAMKEKVVPLGWLLLGLFCHLAV